MRRTAQTALYAFQECRRVFFRRLEFANDAFDIARRRRTEHVFSRGRNDAVIGRRAPLQIVVFRFADGYGAHTGKHTMNCVACEQNCMKLVILLQ